jgi:hypothetical protein
MSRMPLYAPVLFCVHADLSLAQAEKTVNTAADLPRFSYPLSAPASQLLVSEDAAFNAFARKVEADVNSVLSEYTISDKETLRELQARCAAVEREHERCARDLISDTRSAG